MKRIVVSPARFQHILSDHEASFYTLHDETITVGDVVAVFALNPDNKGKVATGLIRKVTEISETEIVTDDDLLSRIKLEPTAAYYK